MKRILVYSHDAYGLGNIRRLLEITHHLVDANPDVSVLLVSGSPMLHAFRIPPRVDYIKLPCVARRTTGESFVRTLDLGFEETIRLRTSVITMAAIGFDPDLLLIDKKPFGIAGELKPALGLLRHRAKPVKSALLLRDILDAPEATIREWEKKRFHEAIDQFYDRVLIAGSEQVFDAAREYRFPESTVEKLCYCGYLRRRPPAKSAHQMRRELDLGDERLVLVTAGGGGDGYPMMCAYLEGLARRPPSDYTTLIVAGPEMPVADREAIASLARGRGGVVVTEFTEDIVSCMHAADLVVAMGGYNTICELLTLKKKMIIVPRIHPVSEQWIRAERMQKLGLLRAIDPHELAPDSLLEAVEEELARDNVRHHALEQFQMTGLERIGAAISELLGTGPAGETADRRRESSIASATLASARHAVAAPVRRNLPVGGA